MRQEIIASAGLQYNWTAELLPEHTVRVLRADGSAWTFIENPVFKRIQVSWPQPPDDDDAEALAAAELSVRRKSLLKSLLAALQRPRSFGTPRLATAD